jgi:hypothetical protein
VKILSDDLITTPTNQHWTVALPSEANHTSCVHSA